MIVPPPRIPDPGFLADLRWALSVMRRHPALPAISVGLILIGWVMPADGTVDDVGEGAASFVGLLSFLVYTGWVGVERIWFLRATRDRAVDTSEFVPLTFRFVWPFVRLGLIAMMLFFIPVLVLVLTAGLRSGSLEQRAAFAVFGILFDVVFTFAAPRLAFSTRSSITAFKDGLRMLRQTWPASSAYVMVPAVTLVALSSLSSPDAPLPLKALLSALSTLVALAVKGAIVAFYLRRVLVGDDGSAYLRSMPQPTRPDL